MDNNQGDFYPHFLFLSKNVHHKLVYSRYFWDYLSSKFKKVSHFLLLFSSLGRRWNDNFDSFVFLFLQLTTEQVRTMISEKKGSKFLELQIYIKIYLKIKTPRSKQQDVSWQHNSQRKTAQRHGENSIFCLTRWLPAGKHNKRIAQHYVIFMLSLTCDSQRGSKSLKPCFTISSLLKPVAQDLNSRARLRLVFLADI